MANPTMNPAHDSMQRPAPRAAADAAGEDPGTERFLSEP